MTGGLLGDVIKPKECSVLRHRTGPLFPYHCSYCGLRLVEHMGLSYCNEVTATPSSGFIETTDLDIGPGFLLTPYFLNNFCLYLFKFEKIVKATMSKIMRKICIEGKISKIYQDT